MFVFLWYCCSLPTYCMNQVFKCFTWKVHIWYRFFYGLLYQRKMFNILVIPTKGACVGNPYKSLWKIRKFCTFISKLWYCKSKILFRPYYQLTAFHIWCILLPAHYDMYHRCLPPLLFLSNSSRWEELHPIPALVYLLCFLANLILP